MINSITSIIRSTAGALALPLFALVPLTAPAAAQDAADTARASAGGALEIDIPLKAAVTTRHTATIRGEEVPYTATAGTLPVYGDEGEAVASLFYVYYERTDVEDDSRRPLTISFNGGPGSASVWMHLGYTGPRRVRIDDEGYPIQPYGFEDNPHSILNVTDIVYVNPVNTGFSRPLDGVDTDQFFGVEDDIEYLAAWIERFVTLHDRWDSPKFLIGESYGTTRVSGLAGELQDSQWLYLNGVMLVSPTGLGIDRDGPVEDALILPHYAATAWYHGQLPPELQSQGLEAVLSRVEAFTINEYIPALVYGGFLDDARRREIASQVARFAGVSATYVLNNNLTIPVGRWRKELLRDQRLTVGRLDARYQGIDRDAGGAYYGYDPALAAWNHAFAPAINMYLREELNYETELDYNVFGPTPNWERDENDTGEALRQAMAENPYLKVMIQSGYYDGATDYFSAQYTMWHIDPSGQLQDRFRYHAYRSGHMMYLRQEDLGTANQDIREFIRWAIPPAGTPAVYGHREPVSISEE